MRSAGGMKRDPTLERELRRANRSTDGSRRAFEHACEQRVLHRSYRIALTGLEIDRPRLGRGAQRSDIVGRMKPFELVDARARADDVLPRREPVEGSDQIDHRLDPRNRQRMKATVRCLPIDVVADKRGRTKTGRHAIR